MQVICYILRLSGSVKNMSELDWNLPIDTGPFKKEEPQRLSERIRSLLRGYRKGGQTRKGHLHLGDKEKTASCLIRAKFKHTVMFTSNFDLFLTWHDYVHYADVSSYFFIMFMVEFMCCRKKLQFYSPLFRLLVMGFWWYLCQNIFDLSH